MYKVAAVKIANKNQLDNCARLLIDLGYNASFLFNYSGNFSISTGLYVNRSGGVSTVVDDIGLLADVLLECQVFSSVKEFIDYLKYEPKPLMVSTLEDLDEILQVQTE